MEILPSSSLTDEELLNQYTKYLHKAEKAILEVRGGLYHQAHISFEEAEQEKRKFWMMTDQRLDRFRQWAKTRFAPAEAQ